MSTAVIDEIKTQINIVDVISDYVSLEQKGKDYWGVCPFHDEKTASFSVSPSKGIYYCFGCHEHGDVFSFVQKINGIDFRAAKSLLAGRAGIPDKKLTLQQRKQIQADRRRKAREKELARKLQAAINEEIERLINIEQWVHSVLKSITSERDFDRPAVIWALHTKDRVGYYLDALFNANATEKLEIIQCTRGWDGWPKCSN